MVQKLWFSYIICNMFENYMQYLSTDVFGEKQQTNGFGSCTDRSFLTHNISNDTFKCESISLIYL